MRNVTLFIAMSLDSYIADVNGDVNWLSGQGPDEWVYSGLKSYVITHKNILATEEIEFLDINPCELVKELKKKTGKDIWICGGAEIVQQLMRENLIDKFYISVIPTILGNGVRLFADMARETKLKLVKTQNYNGIVDLVYVKR